MVARTAVADLLLDPHSATPAELQERLVAERRQAAFLIWRDSEGRQRILSLPDTIERVMVGRAPGSDLWLDTDVKVSRVHATIERAGPMWMLVDDGLSANAAGSSTATSCSSAARPSSSASRSCARPRARRRRPRRRCT